MSNAVKLPLKEEFDKIFTQDGNVITIDLRSFQNQNLNIILPENSISSVQLVTPAAEQVNKPGVVNSSLQRCQIGDLRPDGWIVAGFSEQTGHVFSIDPPDLAQGYFTWDEGNERAMKLRALGHTNARMPSREELKTIRTNLYLTEHNKIARLSDSFHWSSSEYSAISAWNQRFSDGPQSHHVKSYADVVRCARDEPHLRF